MEQRICSVEGCGRKHSARGLCKRCYKRWMRTGDPTKVRPPGTSGQWRAERGCVIEGCIDPHVARGWCRKHYTAWDRWGDPLAYDPDGREYEGRPRGDEPSYTAVHLRLKADYGKAAEHLCVDCGGPAAHWSYAHDCSDERSDAKGPYCPHPEHYSPRCASDHNRYDGRVANLRR